MKQIFLILALTALLTACTTTRNQRRMGENASKKYELITDTSAIPPALKTGRNVIGHLKTQRHWITIFSTGDGARYSLSTLSGDLLTDNLTIEQLRASHPTLNDFEDWYATDASVGRMMLHTR